MVQGREQLRQFFDQIPTAIRREVADEMEKQANTIVREMNALKPLPEIVVAWTWGDEPQGTLKIGRVATAKSARLAITIYATATTTVYPKGFPAIAAWAEFGTDPRFQKTTGRYTGMIMANPYFFPVFRANRSRARGAITRAVKRGLKKVRNT